MPQLPDLSQLSHAEKDALIQTLWQRLEAAEQRIAELEAKLGQPPKTPGNSSLPPSKGQKPNQAEKTKRNGPRQGSLGRRGGGRALSIDPDETSRLGGRGWTHDISGLPLDLGCGWLHSADRNAWAGIATAAGITVDQRDPAWGCQYGDLGFTPAEQAAASHAFAVQSRCDPGG